MASQGVLAASADEQIATLPYVYGEVLGPIGIDPADYPVGTTFGDLIDDGIVTPAQLEAAGFGSFGAADRKSQVTARAGGYTTNVHGQDVDSLVFVDAAGDVVEDAYIPAVVQHTYDGYIDVVSQPNRGDPVETTTPGHEPRYLVDGVEQYEDGTPVPGGYHAADDLARQLAEQGVRPPNDPRSIEAIDAQGLTPDVGGATTPGASVAGITLPSSVSPWTVLAVVVVLIVVVMLWRGR